MKNVGEITVPIRTEAKCLPNVEMIEMLQGITKRQWQLLKMAVDSAFEEKEQKSPLESSDVKRASELFGDPVTRLKL